MAILTSYLFLHLPVACTASVYQCHYLHNPKILGNKRQFGNHGQISCIYERRILYFYLSLYFREFHIVLLYPCMLYTAFYYVNLCKLYCNHGPRA